MNRFPRRPIAGLALSVVAGTALGLRWPAGFLALFLAAGALLAFAAVTCTRREVPGSPAPAFAALALHGTALLTAWLSAAIVVGLPARTPVRDLPIAQSLSLELTGIVVDDPFPTTMRSGTEWRLSLAVEAARADAASARAAAGGEVSLRLRGAGVPTDLRYGDRLVLTGHFDERTPPPRFAPRRPRPAPFLADTARFQRVARNQGNPLIQWCLRMRERCAVSLARGIEDFPREVAVQRSLLLGYRSQMPQIVYRSFARTNTLHIFAISGSHVVVLAAIIVFILSAAGVTRPRWFLALAPLLVTYTVMTGLQPSAVRACLMACLYWLAPLLRRKSDAYATLGLSAILILACVPTNLLDVGFILSYVATLGLMLFYSVFLRPFQTLLAQDPWQIQPDPALRQLARGLWVPFSQLAAGSLAASVVTAPVTAYYFHMFSPIGLLGNLAVLPLSSLIILTGSLSLMLGACAGCLAGVFNHANLLLVAAMDWSIEHLAAVPGGSIDLPVVPLGAVWGLYAALLLWRLRIASTTSSATHYTYPYSAGPGLDEAAPARVAALQAPPH